jgi:hypothetical protein
MERRNFFKTLGAALAGAAIVKPDFTTADHEVEELVTPNTGEVQIWDDPVRRESYTGKCILYEKNKILTEAEEIEISSTEPRKFCLPQPYGVMRSFERPKETILLKGCYHTKQLYNAFTSGTICNVRIYRDNILISCEVIVREIESHLFDPYVTSPMDYCDVQLAVSGKVIIEENENN